MARRSQEIKDGLSAIRNDLAAVSSLGYNPTKVFNDWVALMFYAYQHDDPRYLKIMGEYRNEAPEGHREADHFAMAHAYLLQYMQKTNDEVLSSLYMEYGGNTNIGQFFTPWPVAEMMCVMTMKEPPKDRKFTIYDPTCGAGVFFIAAAKQQTFEENGRAIFIGHDLDINCCRMCALNLMFFNLNGIIIHGNTLTMEVRDAWETRRNALMGGSLLHSDPEKVKEWCCAAMIEANNKAPESSHVPQYKPVFEGQCSLFG